MTKDSSRAQPKTAASTDNKKVRAKYQKPKLEYFGSLVDFTGGLSLPALESGDPQNRHF